MSVWPISPSQLWAGNDGNWSTFSIRAGSGAVVRVLPATSQSSVWTVLPDGCDPASYPGVPADCSDARGMFFDPNTSTTFRYGGYGQGTYVYLPTEPEDAASTTAINYTSSGVVGFDAVGLGTNGDNTPQLGDQVLAAFAGPVPWLGQLGLKAANSSITNLRNDSHYSILGSLNASGDVLSSTWAYTAGSHSRGYFGSLTLGGYDGARGNQNNVLQSSMSYPSDRDLQLVVSELRIGSRTVSAFPSTATYFLDSMIPEVWLPGDVCDELASAYGLIYNSGLDLYLLNSTQHANLTTFDPSETSLTFTLQAIGASANTTQITIPYFDLDLNLTYPFTEGQPQNYFPIRRANTSDQYYLGRTFLQDAYLSVDYDQYRFNISPALFPEPNSRTSFVQIVNHQSTANIRRSSGLSAGAIAGIAVGAFVAAALIAGLVYFFLRKRRRDRLRFSTAATLRTPSIDGTTIYDEQLGKPPMSQSGQEAPSYEYYNKPVEVNGEEQDQFKPELQGSFAMREMNNSRYELYGSSVRRRSDQSRGSISPLPREESQMGRMRHLRQQSDSSFGQPSPASATASPPLGPASPPLLGHPSPPLEMGGGTFPGPFELHGGSRENDQGAAPTSGPETLSAPGATHTGESLHANQSTSQPVTSTTVATTNPTLAPQASAGVDPGERRDG